MRLGRDALATAPADDVHRPAYLNGLASALLERFRPVGGAGDRDEAVALTRGAVTALDGLDPALAWRLEHVATELRG